MRRAAGGLLVEVHPDAEALARAAAGRLGLLLTEAIAVDGRAVFAVSGGSSPWPMLRTLAASEAVSWRHVHVVQVDERIAPEGDDCRNWMRVREVFSGVVPGENLHPMPVTEDDLERAADTYGSALSRITMDRGVTAAHLGLGPDGHTASLFPGDPVTDATGRDVAVTTQAHEGRRRMTLTFEAINAAQHVLWQVQGASKVAMVRRLIEGDTGIPAGRVQRDRAVLMLDRAAAGV